MLNKNYFLTFVLITTLNLVSSVDALEPAIKQEKTVQLNNEIFGSNSSKANSLNGKELHAMTIVWQHFLSKDNTTLENMLDFTFEIYHVKKGIEVAIRTRKKPSTKQIQIEKSGVFVYTIDPNDFSILSIIVR